MTITFADNKSFSFLVAYGRNEVTNSLADIISKTDREVLEIHFASTGVDMGDLQDYYINPDEKTHTITITDEEGNSFVHCDYVIPLKFGMEYVGNDPNPHIILALAQLNETDKTLREVAGKVKVYSGTELEIAIAKTCDLMSETCEATIVAGIDYNDEHYSLTSQDQTNILCWRGVASGGQAVPYHADGKHCRMYDAEEFVGLSNACIGHITHNTTYCNLLMRWIETLTDPAEIYAIVYGETVLPDEYLEEYNTVMTAIGCEQYVITETSGNTSEEATDNEETESEDTSVEENVTTE